MTIRVGKTGLNRQSGFGYVCNRCLVCCRFKTIQLNPYEIARLAGNRGLSTTQFIKRFTTHGGTILQANEDGTCVFLDAGGCSVHADRPLVCRLYPLGRHVNFSGSERFSQIEREEGCRGLCHENGTVLTYLEEQGAQPFMHAADRYLDLLLHLLEKLTDETTGPSEYETIQNTVRAFTDKGADDADLSWSDMDRALDDYCRFSGLTVPESLADKMDMHINAVRLWAE